MHITKNTPKCMGVSKYVFSTTVLDYCTVLDYYRLDY